MEPQTQQPNLDSTGESKFFGVSVRAWLALQLAFTVCIISVGKVVIYTYMIMFHGASDLIPEIKVEEPLYSFAAFAFGFYFGQQKKTS